LKTRGPINKVVFAPWRVYLHALLLAGWVGALASPAAARSLLDARYADLPITLESPAFTTNKRDFTTDVELANFIASLDARDGGQLSWRVISKSAGGRDVHLLILTADGKSAPHEIAASRKPVVWILGMQHGNEPAAGEAALELARRLAKGDLRSVLERITVVIAPRMNPDGAAALRREAGLREGVVLDLNRDHIELASVENQALHRWIHLLPPHMVLDLHEFLVGGRWIERFNVIQASDVQVQSASHPEVADSLRALARDVFDPALEATFKRYGLKSSTYYTLSTGEKPIVQMGSNHPAVARNLFGLSGAVSYLIESRGIGLGRDYYQRRVATHVLAVSAMLRAAAQNVEALKKAVAQARSSWQSGDITVDHNTRRETRELLMLDVASHEERGIKVEFQNSLAITPTLRRSVPVGYLLAADQEAAAQRLAQHGVLVLRTQRAQDANVERYSVRSVRQESNEAGANIERVSADTQLVTLQFAPGSFYVPMAQAQARLAAVLLEPESQGNLLASRTLKTASPLASGVELPVWRLMTPVEFAGPLLEP
jgi:hypothetical protein